MERLIRTTLPSSSFRVKRHRQMNTLNKNISCGVVNPPTEACTKQKGAGGIVSGVKEG